MQVFLVVCLVVPENLGFMKASLHISPETMSTIGFLVSLTKPQLLAVAKVTLVTLRKLAWKMNCWI